MSMTKEELVYSFAIRQFHKAPINTERDLMCVCSDFANEFLAQPLSSRLTAEEKERVKVIYNEELGMAQHFRAKAKASNDISCRQHYYRLCEPYISRMKLLERIFGADFFKEEE